MQKSNILLFAILILLIGSAKAQNFEVLFNSGKQIFPENVKEFQSLLQINPDEIYEDKIYRFVSIYSKNREEWVITDFACILSGITSVTLYDTLGPESIEYILDQTFIKTVVCSADKVKNVVELKKQGKIPSTTHIIYFDEIKSVDEVEANSCDIKLVKYKEALEKGRKIAAESEKK